jgi:hypothetical protein
MSILMKQVSDEPAPASVHYGELTPAIDEVIAWLMKKDPAARPPDLRTAVGALEQAAAQAGLVETPTRAWDAQTGPVSAQVPAVRAASATRMASLAASDAVGEPTRPRSRARVLAALAALAVIGAAVVLVVLSQRGDQPPAAEPAPAREPVATPPPPPPPAPIEEVKVADPPPEPQTVIVTITGVPDGTEVHAGGMMVGAAPGPVQLPRDAAVLVLTFKAPGYLAASSQVVPDRDQTMNVTLKKQKSSGGGPRPPRKDDILDPFAPKKGRP